MKCRHCSTEMVKHEEGEKEGCWHCNGCGCCFLSYGRKLRPGHPICKEGSLMELPEDEPEPDTTNETEAEAEEPVVEEEKPITRARR